MPDSLHQHLRKTASALAGAREAIPSSLQLREVGTVHSCGSGIAMIRNLRNIVIDELLNITGGGRALAFNIDQEFTGAVLLDHAGTVRGGAEVTGTGRVMDFPVGEKLLGRLVDARGAPLDRRGSIGAEERWPVERPAPGIMDRDPVTVPLATGLKVIDALIPIGRGQRELILGDRQTGKTALAVDTMINQRDQDVRCIYCAIGKRASAVARVIADLKQYQALDYCTIVVATEDDPPGLQFIAPYAAMTLGEFYMASGHDVLLVFDDLTRHARAYRELSLLLRRPPGREAFPGDIFYIHARLLERSTHLRDSLGGGSLTALPIVETEAQNISAYIPTNLISITDGQIYLSPDLFQKGVLPAVDVGKSVSRVGGKTQLAAYRAVAGDLKLAYSQFEELEAFSRFGTRLDEETRQTLRRGRRVRAVLNQPQYSPLPVSHQIAVLAAASQGVFDSIAPEQVAETEQRIRQAFDRQFETLRNKIDQGEKLSEEDMESLAGMAREQIPEPPDQEGKESNADHSGPEEDH
ncbi:alternate F1F0 ATPase, F1 subunit alpha [Desulfofustis glycolicus]|uniref:ATP synthase subunit alpha n=1 Tax=Desulfofustis glycolicus DSM 9705 TaxID=1121409 RepID=A0A1M5SJT4_9BACT|nr:alternate F1F0 ATPase, F1 subunit alpha [Desulfofustis glycolicus]MCB2215775.1 alternate F1F0 ATPase, F1 subunit alpha [Desulfobulbaceae bacterium]SHH38650.1 F-type H+-transporting ATPase subunit alpha [Desulfofustis glycolicus DSM 9705]